MQGVFLSYLISSHNANTLLPGGHVEIGEGMAQTVQREFMEELGKDCHIRSYLGAVENAWTAKNGENQQEINHIFLCVAPDLEPLKAVISQEPNLEFIWSSPEDLDRHNLLPTVMRDLIRQWVLDDRSPWWGSTLA